MSRSPFVSVSLAEIAAVRESSRGKAGEVHLAIVESFARTHALLLEQDFDTESSALRQAERACLLAPL